MAYGIIFPGVPQGPAQQADLYDLQGRVTGRLLWTHEAPSPKASRVKMYLRDLIVPITGAEISEDESATNRVWYEIGDKGYVYSGSIQPVRTILNEPQNISLKGALGEVSVPYTEAREGPDPNAKAVYRLYYETIHWIEASAINSSDGSAWYYLLDDKYQQHYYAPAKHIRLLADDELTPLSPNVPDENKLVEVKLNDQLVLAYENGQLVFATRASTGGIFRVGTYTTPTGSFITFHKRPTRHMAAGDITASGFDLPGVPWVMYITDGGISLHGTYWHNDFGRPKSHGCISAARSHCPNLPKQ